MEGQKNESGNHDEKSGNQNEKSGNQAEKLEDNLSTSGKPTTESGNHSDKPQEDTNKRSSQPSADTKKKRIAPLSIRTDQSTKDLFQQLSNEYGGTHEEFLQKIIHNYQNPPQAPEPKIIEKPVEVIKEVEKGLPDLAVVVQLSEKEDKLMDFISNFRFKKGLGTRNAGDGIVRESKGDILRKSFFNKHRLRDIDGEFYTGLTQQHFKD